jgi:hypothetical protein
MYSACLSPESVAIIDLYLAGLLACFLFTAFPSRPEAAQWRSVNHFRTALGGTDETHSYGDSAGITPDFPFNPSRLLRDRGPDIANVMESWKRTLKNFILSFPC